jgi:hypothetical protein
LHEATPWPVIVRGKEVALEEELVWEALVEMMITTVQTLVMVMTLEWMESCTRMALRQKER